MTLRIHLLGPMRAFDGDLAIQLANGDKVSEGPIENPGGYGYGAAAAVYSCGDEAGELLLDVAPTTGLPPILFNRVSTDRNKP